MSTTRFQDLIHEPFTKPRMKMISGLLDAADQAEADRDFEAAQWLEKQVTKLESCGWNPVVRERVTTGELLLSQSRCKSRLCPLCLHSRSRFLRGRLIPIVRKIDPPRHLTLTLRSSDSSLFDQLQRLMKSFAKLRRHKLWKEKVKGGFYVIEVTFNASKNTWHPHIHAILDGQYIAFRQLQAAWLEVTGDSNYVHIKRTPTQAAAVNYLTSYVGKGSDVARYPKRKIGEWATSTIGMRLVSTFGSHHGVRLGKTDRAPIGETELVAQVSQLWDDARDADPLAMHLVDELMKLKPPIQLKTNRAIQVMKPPQIRLKSQLIQWKDRYKPIEHTDPPLSKKQIQLLRDQALPTLQFEE